MTTYTYDAIPAGIDAGNVLVGVPSIVQFIVKYIPVDPNASTVSGDVFYIQDNGSVARDFVLLSVDGNNYYNKINIPTFPPDNYVQMWVKVNPLAPFYMQQDYSVEIRSTINTNFRLPMRFRIIGARLCTTNDVRKHIGIIGYQKSTIAIAGDEFDNLNAWTQVSGSWSAANNRSSVAGVGSTQEGVMIFSAPTFGDYAIAVTPDIASGQGGILFGYVDSNNYYAVMLDPVNNLVKLIRKLSGVTTTLKTVTQSMTISTTYMIEVKSTSQGLVSFQFDGSELFNYSFPSSIQGSVGLRAYDSPSLNFISFNLNTDVYTVDDADINDFIEEAEQHIYDRTRKLFSQKVFQEYYDFRSQEMPEMPFVLARSFNTLPNWTFRRLFQESTLHLQQRPVLNVISLEENEGSDGSPDTWAIRSQGRDGDYVVYPSEGMVVWINNLPHNGHRNIRVTYAAGEPQVPRNVRNYCALLAAQRLLVGYGSPSSGMEQLKKSVDAQILQLEEYIPPATLLGSPGGTQGGESTVVVG